MTSSAPPSPPGPRPEVADTPPSGIMEVRTYGSGRPGLIPLWVGEGDLPTPAFICDAAARALAAGDTFYTWQRGLPELRQAIARYMARLHGRPFPAERFFVTIGGMHAAHVALRIAVGTGDEVLIPTPAWPNFLGAITVTGARPVAVPLDVGRDGWRLDLDRLRRAVTPRTRAIVVNSPANPTGWTATADDLRAILDLARAKGLWVIADEIYGRFVFDAPGGLAPSFHDVMHEEDRIFFVQTFSKNWAMTGWRLGWLEAPPALAPIVENVVHYSTSGVAPFLQRAAITALDEGEPFVAEQVARARRGRDLVTEGLRASGLVDLPPPPGAFYAFFRVAGIEDSRALALRLIDEANVGLAPGSAFGPGGPAHLRLCFARRAEDLEEAVRRLVAALQSIAAAGEGGHRRAAG
jgi:aspartate/methionine/tyrosine aminotransferase